MRRALSLPVLALTVGVAIPALAQQELMCAPREEVARQLGAQFSEVAVTRGLTGDGMLLEVFASPEGTWTAVLSEPKGVSCLVSGGEAWQMVDPSRNTGIAAPSITRPGREYRF